MYSTLAAIKIAYLYVFGADFAKDYPYAYAANDVVKARPNDYKAIFAAAEAAKGAKDADGNYVDYAVIAANLVVG